MPSRTAAAGRGSLAARLPLRNSQLNLAPALTPLSRTLLRHLQGPPHLLAVLVATAVEEAVLSVEVGRHGQGWVDGRHGLTRIRQCETGHRPESSSRLTGLYRSSVDRRI